VNKTVANATQIAKCIFIHA